MPATLGRQAVVFRMSLHEPPRLRAMETLWCPRLLPAGRDGTTSRIFIAIPVGGGSRSLGQGEDQFAPILATLPPKPKWMRWRTYNRAVEKFDVMKQSWTQTAHCEEL